MNQQFALKRWGRVLQKDCIENWRGSVLGYAVVAGILVFNVLVNRLLGQTSSWNYTAFFYGAYGIWGSVLAAMAFRESHDKHHNEDFLLLPASALEKTLSRLLIYVFAVPVLILGVVSLTSFVAEGLSSFLFQTPFQPFNPFQKYLWKVVRHILILHSVFFVGAAWFKKRHWLKTNLTLMIVVFALSFLGYVMMATFFGSWGSDGFTDVSFSFDLWNNPALERWFEVLKNISNFFYSLLLAPFCWFVAWLRVKETQSSDGI